MGTMDVNSSELLRYILLSYYFEFETNDKSLYLKMILSNISTLL